MPDKNGAILGGRTIEPVTMWLGDKEIKYQDPAKFVQASMDPFFVIMEQRDNIVLFRMVSSIDPKMSVPAFILNLFIEKILQTLLYVFDKKAAKLGRETCPEQLPPNL